jgi:hypothetical protein
MQDLVVANAVANLSHEIEKSTNSKASLLDCIDPSEVWKKTAMKVHTVALQKAVLKREFDVKDVYKIDEEDNDINQMVDGELQRKSNANNNVNDNDIHLPMAQSKAQSTFQSSRSSSENPNFGEVKLYEILDAWEEPAHKGVANVRNTVEYGPCYVYSSKHGMEKPEVLFINLFFLPFCFSGPHCMFYSRCSAVSTRNVAP